MKLDNKTRDRILEIVAVTALADEEMMLGIPQTADSVRGLRGRAIRRYHGPMLPSEAFGIGQVFADYRFTARVKRTAYMIFEAIECNEDADAQLQAWRELFETALGYVGPR